MKELLEAGVHFGHKVSNWNPKMKNYIFIKRRSVHIINLQKTLLLFEQAFNFAKNVTANGGKILFVGTKKQAQQLVREHATRSGQHFVTHHWMGGLLTNFSVVRQSIDKLDSIRTILSDPNAKQKYLKRDLMKMEKNLNKQEENLGGVKAMKTLPQLLFVVDAHIERGAVSEANAMNIPVCAMVDTNTSPDDIDLIIPSNDDAIRSIGIFVERMADAAIEGTAFLKRTDEEAKLALTVGPQTSPDAENAVKTELPPEAQRTLKAEKVAAAKTHNKFTQTPTQTPKEKQSPTAVTVKPAAVVNAPSAPPAAKTGQELISAKAVKELRELTQVGMMECKAALTAANGDQTEAIRILKEKGMALMAKKSASREAYEGVIFLAEAAEAKQLTAIQFLCETDFVAKNADFNAFVTKVGEAFITKGETFLQSSELEAMLSQLVSKLREKIVIGETVVIKHSPQTATGSYLHTNKKLAGFVTATIPEAEVNNVKRETLQNVLKELAMQVTAMDPLALSIANIGAEQKEQERQIFLKQLESEEKSTELKGKIVEGKLKKYFSERCLLEMNFVKDTKLTVKQYLASQAAACGLKQITLSNMQRLAIGKN